MLWLQLIRQSTLWALLLKLVLQSTAGALMKTRSNVVYALFKKKFSSFALFDGRYGASFAPYQYSQGFCIREEDKKFIVGLRKWWVDDQPNLGSNDLFFLREIKEGERFSLICKILHICEVIKGEWLLFVWDGTDAPPLNIKTKLEDEMENALPLQLEPLPLSRDILCSFPTVGTVLRLFINQGDEKLDIHVIKIGRWMKLVNIKCEVYAGMWRGVIMPSTKFCHLHDEDDATSQCQRSYDERVASKVGRMPWWSFPWPCPVTEIDYPDVPFLTLMDILTHTKASGKFRCVVRVMAVMPWRAEDFCSPCGTYRIRLTLEDPTARVHAFIWGEDGDYLFGGYPSVDVLTRKRDILLGVVKTNDGKEIKDAPRNPPWVQVCLGSYYVDKSDIWGSRNFKIFATKLVEK